MQRRLARSAVVLAAVTLLATACAAAPAPSPTPTPTGFESEEEAFAAAEETYRAYVEAANNVNLKDPETFEPLYELTTGAALAAAREEFTMMHAEGYQREGTTAIALLEHRSADVEGGTAELDVCVDNSDLDVLDESGASVVSPDRPDIQPMRIEFELRDDRSALISSALARTGEPECPAH